MRRRRRIRDHVLAEYESIFAGQTERDPEITFLIGLFVARWSLAEYSLMMAYLVATGSSRQEVATTVLASTNSAEAKIKIVLKLIAIAPIDESRRGAIRKAIKRLEKLCPERNALMHHLWGHRDNGESVTIDYRESDEAKQQTVRTATSLRSLSNDVVDAALSICVATGSKWIDDAAAAQLKV